MSFETEKEIQFDDLLFYLRQGAGLIEGFPKMAGRECVPPRCYGMQPMRLNSYVIDLLTP